MLFFFFSSRRRHTRSLCDWSSDVCSSDLEGIRAERRDPAQLARAHDGEVAPVQANARANWQALLAAQLGTQEDLVQTPHPASLLDHQHAGDLGRVAIDANGRDLLDRIALT